MDDDELLNKSIECFSNTTKLASSILNDDLSKKARSEFVALGAKYIEELRRILNEDEENIFEDPIVAEKLLETSHTSLVDYFQNYSVFKNSKESDIVKLASTFIDDVFMKFLKLVNKECKNER